MTDLRETITRDAALMLAGNPDWRAGQAIFNTAMAHCADRADALRGSSIDPFYDDDKITQFLDALVSR